MAKAGNIQKNKKNNHGISPLYVYYDGKCFVCKNFSFYLLLKKNHIHIINLRGNRTTRKNLIRKGRNPDKGIIVQENTRYLQGVDAIVFMGKHIIQHEKKIGILQKIIFWLCTQKSFVVICYPLFLFIRKMQFIIQDFFRFFSEQSEQRKKQ